MRPQSTLIIALVGLLSASVGAEAQSVGAPTGRDPATAPGGTEGLAGPRNASQAIRSGDAIAVPPPTSAAPRSDGIPAGEQADTLPAAPRVPAGR